MRISAIERHIKRKSKIIEILLGKTYTVIERNVGTFVKKIADREMDRIYTNKCLKKGNIKRNNLGRIKKMLTESEGRD